MSFDVKVVKTGEGSKSVTCEEGDTVADALETTPWGENHTILVNGDRESDPANREVTGGETIALSDNHSGG